MYQMVARFQANVFTQNFGKVHKDEKLANRADAQKVEGKDRNCDRGLLIKPRKRRIYFRKGRIGMESLTKASLHLLYCLFCVPLHPISFRDWGALGRPQSTPNNKCVVNSMAHSNSQALMQPCLYHVWQHSTTCAAFYMNNGTGCNFLN